MAITNNEFTTNSMSSGTPSSSDQIKKINTELSIENGDVKFGTLQGKASLVASDDQLALTNTGNGMVINAIGTVVDGLFHIGRQPSDIRISTFWTFNNELLTCLPSTTYTPIPVLVYKEPATVKFVAALAKVLSSAA